MTKTKAQHTPGKAHWGAINLTERLIVSVQDEKHPEHTTLICELPAYIGNDANAEHIAKTWNCHDELIAACLAAYDQLPTTATPAEFLANEGNWGLTEQEHRLATTLANAIARAQS